MPEEITTEVKEMQLSKNEVKQIKEIQSCLNAKGFECQIDGVLGPVTTNAIKRYQSEKRSRLKVDGIPGEKTLALLLEK
jgi:peptidoglycan hydrolase-like protein with peptidoglycan-binding domain